MFAAKVLHIYFTIGCLRSVTLLVSLVSYNWNLILIETANVSKRAG